MISTTEQISGENKKKIIKKPFHLEVNNDILTNQVIFHLDSEWFLSLCAVKISVFNVYTSKFVSVMSHQKH